MTPDQESQALASSEDEELSRVTRGLLDRARHALMPRTPLDETLLVEAMLLVASADGKLDPEEQILFETYSQILRDFRGSDFRALLRSAQSNIEHAGTGEKAVARLAHLSTDALKRKCFVLAVDFAFVSGEITGPEASVVAAMSEVLGLDESFVRAAIEIAACRHAGPRALGSGPTP